MTIPVLTIDGPSASGKGTVARRVAKKLGWHYLDSGLPYRVVAFVVAQAGLVDPDDDSADLSDEFVEKLRSFLSTLEISLEQEPDSLARISYNHLNIKEKDLRIPAISQLTSRLSAIPIVRQYLLELQHQQRRAPGLVTDGRDMGTVVFPDAPYKVFLEASAEERAQRRHNQLKEQGNHVTLRRIQEDLEARDRRDRERNIAPTVPADDAQIIDSTDLDIEAVVARILKLVPERGN